MKKYLRFILSGKNQVLKMRYLFITPILYLLISFIKFNFLWFIDYYKTMLSTDDYRCGLVLIQVLSIGFTWLIQVNLKHDKTVQMWLYKD